MTIEAEKVDRTTVTLRVFGRIDTANASLLEQKIKQWGDEITLLILDFEKVDYISSMGLRVLLYAKKTSTEKKREFVIRNMTQSVREIFEITGFINQIVRDEGFALLRNDEDGAIVFYLNGELAIENVPTLSNELYKIREQWYSEDDSVTVILDMQRLYCIMPHALKHLRQALADTAWQNRDLLVRNVPADYLKEMEKGGLGELITSE